jgi:CRP/FNR family transcriptional regulator, cyclic AMP receptor protein
LKISGGKVSFSGFAAGKTYLLRFSGSVAIAGSSLGLAAAPGAFTVDNLANDVLLSSFPAARLAVAGVPGAYQLAVQRGPTGNALRYGAPAASGSCPALPARPALPGTSVQLVAAPAPWSGSVRVDVLAYGGPATSSAGKTDAATESGSGTFFARESSRYLFSWKGSTYRATGVQFTLTARVSEQLGARTKSPRLLAGTASVAMFLTKVKGSAAAKARRLRGPRRRNRRLPRLRHGRPGHGHRDDHPERVAQPAKIRPLPGAPVDVLQRVRLFADLDRREVEQIALLFKQRTFAEGETVIREGSGGAAFYVIESGEVTVTIGGEHRATLGPGDYFGEIALIDEGARIATIVASAEVKCYGLTLWEFRPLVEANGVIGWKLMQTLARELRDAEHLLSSR